MKGDDMKHIRYETGRTYDTDQVLDILVEEYGTDEWGTGVVTATFTDESRHINGRVINAPVFGDDIGEAVLSAYDHGQYQSL